MTISGIIEKVIYGGVRGAFFGVLEDLAKKNANNSPVTKQGVYEAMEEGAVQGAIAKDIDQSYYKPLFGDSFGEFNLITAILGEV